MPRPTTRPCPHHDCPSHLPGGRSHVVRHSRFQTRRGPRRRLLCRVCGRTFVPSLGTPYYRMRRRQSCFDGAMRLVVEGVSQASIARAQGVSPATVSRWIERAAGHGRRFLETKLRPESAVEVQVDELKARAGDNDRTWVYGAIEVWSRLWLAHWVGPRTLRSTLLFVRALRGACGALRERILFTSDEFKYYAPTLRRTFGQACVHVEVKNRYLRDRILSSESRVRFGTPEQAEEALARSEDSRRPNTAFIERLLGWQKVLPL